MGSGDFPHRSAGALQNEVRDRQYPTLYAEKYRACWGARTS
eukprot:gene17330-43337_t